MTTLDYFISGGWQKKAPADVDERPYIIENKGSNNSINSQEFDEFCKEEYDRIVAEDAQPHEWVAATPTASTAMAIELAPVAPMDGNSLLPTANNPEFDFCAEDPPEPLPDGVTELPIWGLPDDLQAVVEDVTKGYRSYRSFAVSGLMCATSCVMGKRVTTHHDNYTNHATIWLITVIDSGRSKSSPMRFFFEPIQQKENTETERYKAELSRWKASRCEGEEPVYKRRLLGKATDEYVLKALAQHGDLFWFNDEIRTTIEGWGLYKNGSSGVIVGSLLEVFGNECSSVDRVGSEPMRLVHPNLGIAGTTQPSTLKLMMAKKKYDEDGMFQRFLYDFPVRRKRPPRKKHIINEHSHATWRKYYDILSSMEMVEMYETPEAEKLHYEVLEKWDALADEYEDNGVMAMSAYVDKLNYHLCRWCACVAVLRGEQSITADVMRYSIECIHYFLRCAERAYCLIANLSEESKQKEPTTKELIQQLYAKYPNMIKAKVAEGLGITRQTFQQFFD